MPLVTSATEDNIMSKTYDTISKVIAEGLLAKKSVTIDIDFISSDSELMRSTKKYNVKAKITGRGTADLTGKPADVKAWLLDNGWDMEDIKDLYPEVTF